MSKPKVFYCKIGTMPAWVHIKSGRAPTKIGQKIQVRDAEPGTKYITVVVDRINDDGYFFASKL